MPNVVYRPFPTSNHNYPMLSVALPPLYIVRFLHQTTTTLTKIQLNLLLYIVRFLHQTTTQEHSVLYFGRCISSVSYIKPQRWMDDQEVNNCCISSVSYIKPQLTKGLSRGITVVYRPFPTSNHNLRSIKGDFLLVVYRPFPTSNHNLFAVIMEKRAVVYRPFPTSNHNA